METKHTPGEWTVGERKTNGIKGYEIHYGNDGECITDHVYTLADATLIAAAPEMLDALLFMAKKMQGETTAIMINAIEDATGMGINEIRKMQESHLIKKATS